MSWLRKPEVARPSLPRLRETPDGVWMKCPACGEILYRKEVERSLWTCGRCGAHFRISAADYIALFCDPGSFQELFTDAVLRAGGCILEHEHPVLGPLLMPGAFIDLDATPVVVARSSPVLGADGAEVLAEIGYAPERIDALVAVGAVGRPA